MIKKSLLRTLFVLTAAMIAATVYGAEKEIDNSSVPGIFAMGNGNMCVYGRQADILQAFGAPYSAPAMFNLNAVGIDSVVSQRVPQTAVWKHDLFKGTQQVGNYTDFVSTSSDAFIRQMNNMDTVEYVMEFKLEDRYQPYDSCITVGPSNAKVDVPKLRANYRVEITPGVPFYSSYKSPRGYFYQLIVAGAAELTPSEDNAKKLTLRLLPGESTLMLISGTSEEDLKANIKTIGDNTVSALQSATEKSWKSYSSEQRDFSTVNLSEPMRKEFDRAVDDIGVLIKSQQGVQGSVLAGIVYHMGYVRDQYGVSRALLALGHNQEARDMLNFYYNVWKDNGFIRNAQAIGYKSIFHCHENDETEITGYLIVQAFDYYNKTKDTAFLKEIMPMLEWATDVQQKYLIDGMMPFNGDETYIAGGVVPRKVMYNGSAESTLLFIEGSYRLLDFVREQELWDQNKIQKLSTVVEDCRDKYRSNFYSDGKFYLNNPARELKATYPETRPGVCLHPNHGDYFTKTYHFKGPLYFCKACMKKDNSQVQIPEAERFNIPSANLFPIYINAQLFTAQEKKALLDTMIAQYKATGKISSVSHILGYDYGLFLYALAASGNELADEVYKKMMGLRDNAGAWVEYYVNGVPFGCGCRPWESGINIEAAIQYAGMMK